MEDVITRQPRPTTPADLHRLAALAHERGLRLVQERGTGAWFCSSASTPGEAHYVTGYSCTCPGFCYHQRCTHHALLLDRLGWLPVVECESVMEAPPLTLIPCGNCSGGGVVYVKECAQAGWPMPTCPVCTGAGEIQPQVQLASPSGTVAAQAA
jgi:hypothetical protein